MKVDEDKLPPLAEPYDPPVPSPKESPDLEEICAIADAEAREAAELRDLPVALAARDRRFGL